MIDLGYAGNIISEIIQERYGDCERFYRTGLRCVDNFYLINGVMFEPSEIEKYKELLEKRVTAGVMEKNTGVMNGSTAEYQRSLQLSNGENADVNIAMYKSGSVNMSFNYDNDRIRLYRDNYTQQIANELILPELNIVARIMNLEKESQGQEK